MKTEIMLALLIKVLRKIFIETKNDCRFESYFRNIMIFYRRSKNVEKKNFSNGIGTEYHKT